MLAALLLLAAAPGAAAPSPEAVQLGRDIAATGFLATLAPIKTRAEIDEMIAAHPNLTPEQQRRLRAIGEATAAAMLERIIDTEGRAIAANLSVEDLRTIVAFAATGAAQRHRAAMVPVVMATATALEGLDYGGSVKAAFCAETGKLCQQ